MANPSKQTPVAEAPAAEAAAAEAAAAEAAAAEAAAAEAAAAEAADQPRPVKLQSTGFRITSPLGATYYNHRTTDLNDLNAPEAHFERAQIREGVLIIVQG